eukprot:scaffold321923_cov14-Tisochrysis_lutea.AAC.1
MCHQQQISWRLRPTIFRKCEVCDLRGQGEYASPATDEPETRADVTEQWLSTASKGCGGQRLLRGKLFRAVTVSGFIEQASKGCDCLRLRSATYDC